MLRSALRSPRLYNVKPGRTQPAGPALLLDTSMWDLTPTGGEPALEPADEDAIQGSHILDKETRSRRGLPVCNSARELGPTGPPCASCRSCSTKPDATTAPPAASTR